jgi:Spy/CpxP family protein refolding chaperone
MKWKVIVAVLALVAISAVLFAATAAALNDTSNNANTAYSGSNRGAYWYGEDGNSHGEGGMMNLWGLNTQNTNGYNTNDGWNGHR